MFAGNFLRLGQRLTLTALLGTALLATSAWSANAVLFVHPRPAPALNAMTVSGQPLHLYQLRGKVVLLNFWATWCGPCRMEIPELIRLQREYPGKLQILGLSVDIGDGVKSLVANFGRQMGVNYPLAVASGALQRRYGGIRYTPTSVLIDPQGRVEQVLEGMRSYSEFNTDIRALLHLPFAGHIVRVNELSPNGKVSTINIPGLHAALLSLTPAQREIALKDLNTVQCDCGCRWSLASCRVQDPHCGYSLPEALALIKKIKSGKLK